MILIFLVLLCLPLLYLLLVAFTWRVAGRRVYGAFGIRGVPW